MRFASSDNPPEQELTRRNFVKYLSGFSILATMGGVLVPIIGYLWPPSRQRSEKGSKIRVASLAEVQAAGGLVVPANGEPIILTYNPQTSVRAFSGICPHLGCVVRWHSGQYIECPCHDGRFNAQTGAVISGPPPGPLPAQDVVVDGDDVFIVT